MKRATSSRDNLQADQSSDGILLPVPIERQDDQHGESDGGDERQGDETVDQDQVGPLRWSVFFDACWIAVGVTHI